MDVRLPHGLVATDGERYRTARIGPLCGLSELEAPEAPNALRAVQDVLLRSLVRLGPYEQDQITAEVLGRLLPVDRDYLLVQLTRMSFGDVAHLVVVCPQQACGAKMDLAPDLTDVQALNLPDGPAIDVRLDDGRMVRLRNPTCADQIALWGAASEVRDRLLLDRCVIDTPSTVSRPGLATLDEGVCSRLATTLLEHSPVLDLSAELECVECGKPFVFTYNPVEQLLGALHASRPLLLRQIHEIAKTYHWSLAEILSLPTTQRHAFLDEIAADR